MPDTCHCGRAVCPLCRRCPASGHHEDCQSETAQRARAYLASLETPRERAVGSLLELLLRSDEDATL